MACELVAALIVTLAASLDLSPALTLSLMRPRARLPPAVGTHGKPRGRIGAPCLSASCVVPTFPY